MRTNIPTPSFQRTIKQITDFHVGQNYSFQINITEVLVTRFAELTGDYNPLHMDENFASKTLLRRRVVHGMLVGSFVSTLIGMHIPGNGGLWLSQTFDFLLPVHIGDTLSIEGTIEHISTAQKILVVSAQAKNQNGHTVLKGEGKVKLMEISTKVVAKPIKDLTVLVVGGSRGLGAATVLQFAREGARILLNFSKSRDAAEQVATVARREFGATVNLIEGDFTSEEGVRSMTSAPQFSNTDAVIFCAMANLTQNLFLDQEPSDFERAVDFGLRGPMRVLKLVLPKMIERNFGRIVSVLTTYSIGTPPPGFSSYIVNKNCLAGLTKSIAVEYGKFNITANMVSPNMLRTDLTQHVTERTKQLIEAQSPLRRLASLEEIASSISHLCSPGSSYTNGHNLIISGGSPMN